MSQVDKSTLLNRIRTGLADTLTVNQMEAVMTAIESAMVGVTVEIQDTGCVGADELLDAFLSAKEIEGRSKKTVDRYRYLITRFFDTITVKTSEITVTHVRRYLADLKRSGSCDNTIEGVRQVLSSFFGWCLTEGLIKVNPCRNVGAIKVPKLIRKPYSQTDIELIRENCKTLRDKALVYFLMSTGCRISEVCALNQNDVDFRSLQCVVYGKGSKERTVYLDAVAAMTLTKYLNARSDTSEALFVGKGSDRMGPNGVRKMLKQIEERSGVENIHPHRFRRTLATNLIDRGMSVQDVAKILGHDNINTTMKYIYQSDQNIRNSYYRYSA